MTMKAYSQTFHDGVQQAVAKQVPHAFGHLDAQVAYSFANFFHPFVGELIARLNEKPLADLFDPAWQASLTDPNFFATLYGPPGDANAKVTSEPKQIDVSNGGPYANYNWELFFHIPLTVATHLSKNQRFAEAQRWFHYVFDPTLNDPAVNPPDRFWRFLGFRQPGTSERIEDIIRLLSIPTDTLSAGDKQRQAAMLTGYDAIRRKPFQPHAVARTRRLAYAFNLVMKYLDNLIAWGDSLFQQDTLESINEATQLYVLASNVLGERPQRIPPLGKTTPKTFAQLKADGLGPIGDAFTDLQAQFPLNLAAPALGAGDGNGVASSPLFGIGRTLYFCLPPNDKLLGYWDTVADRLFKIRHCMNIQGIVRPLALFDPPIDPGMLVKAAAAGIDVGSIVSGLGQPVGPVRCAVLIQKTLELCSEVRALGNTLLAALEKGDAEHLSRVRQRHEIQIQQLAQDARFLQWKSAQEATKSLLTSRATALERLRYYQRLLGFPADPNAPDTLPLDGRELTEDNFDEAYGALVGQYDKSLALQKFPDVQLAGGASPAEQSGAAGVGKLYLDSNENADLNVHAPNARDARLAAIAIDTLHAPLSFIPEVNVDVEFWGLGAHATVFGGSMLVAFGHFLSSVANMGATGEESQAANASKTAGYQRRADDWLLQYNLAAHELMQLGRQILTSLIAEQIAHHEYVSVQQQIANAQEIDQLLHDKFTNEELYLWMQGEASRLYYEFYRFAFDTARKAERTMKRELMRPELDAQDFVQFNYWDAGRKGLLAGEALYLDVKRMELAYLETNRRELELTKHVSLRQLDPARLLILKATGSCQVPLPEWLFDLDCPAFLRCLKTVAVSIPSIAGPHASVNCTLSLLKSSVRTTAASKNGRHERQGADDDRFIDYVGAMQSIVTSGGSNDSGMFEVNLRDDRFLPFERAGAESTWQIDLPKDYRAFDYATISDVVLHVRYTARLGVDAGLVKTALDDMFQDATQSPLALLWSLRHDFPNEWNAFVSGAADFTATIRRDWFPYVAQRKTITITALEMYDGSDVTKHHAVGTPDVWTTATADLAAKQAFTVTAPADPAGPTETLTRTAAAEVFLLVRYTLSG